MDRKKHLYTASDKHNLVLGTGQQHGKTIMARDTQQTSIPTRITPITSNYRLPSKKKTPPSKTRQKSPTARHCNKTVDLQPDRRPQHKTNPNNMYSNTYILQRTPFTYSSSTTQAKPKAQNSRACRPPAPGRARRSRRGCAGCRRRT